MSSNQADIFADIAPIEEVKASSARDLFEHYPKRKPFIVRGLVRDWPIVKAGLESGEKARAYLLSKSLKRPFVATVGPRGVDGRIFYDEAVSYTHLTLPTTPYV